MDYTKTGLEKRESEHEGRKSNILLQSASVGQCYVEQFNHREEYGYEYMNLVGVNDKGLCVGAAYTPLTER